MLKNEILSLAAKFEKLAYGGDTADKFSLDSTSLIDALKKGPVNYYAPGFQQEAAAVFRNMLQKYNISVKTEMPEVYVYISASIYGNVYITYKSSNSGPADFLKAVNDTVNVIRKNTKHR